MGRYDNTLDYTIGIFSRRKRIFTKPDSVWVNIKTSITAVNAFYSASAPFPREVGVGVLIEKM